MAYKKHEWKARLGTGLNKFRDQDGKLYEFTSAPDSVSQPGTPFSADWMNEMEEGIAAAGITYLTSTAASGATSISITANAPETVAKGDHFRIYFKNQVGAGAKLNIGGTGAKPIINNYTASAIVQGDIPADYTADIMYDGADYVLLNALVVSGTPTGYAFFTNNGSFTVPNFVTAIKVSACAAGVGRYAGEYIVDQIFNVTPGQMIELTVGSGNTVIGDLATLVAGTVASSHPTTKLGYAAGYNGNAGQKQQNKVSGDGGFGGAFGFGGAGGGRYDNNYKYGNAGGNGVGVGAGAGGRGSYATNGTPADGGDSANGKLLYIGAQGTLTKGGGGSLYASGGGGGSSINGTGGGGAAGGYGAGGGETGGGGSYGQPSNGMVLIEWGGGMQSGSTDNNDPSDQNPLPDGFTLVEYIQSSGTQYINPDILLSYTNAYSLRVVADIEITEKSGDYCVTGSGAQEPIVYFGVTNNGYIGYGDVLSDKVISTKYIQGRYVWDYNIRNKTLSVGDDTYSIDVTNGLSDSASRYFCISAYAEQSTVKCHSQKIYNYKFYMNGYLVRNLVPCINKNGEYGLFDKIGLRFYGNAGSGVFTGAQIGGIAA